MSTKTLIWIFMFIGGTIGGYIPALWGAPLFSFSAVIFNALGALAGIYIGFKLGE